MVCSPRNPCCSTQWLLMAGAVGMCVHLVMSMMLVQHHGAAGFTRKKPLSCTRGQTCAAGPATAQTKNKPEGPKHPVASSQETTVPTAKQQDCQAAEAPFQLPLSFSIVSTMKADMDALEDVGDGDT